ncbi:MAG TPA: hypothetical protein VGH27_32400 [Streptosporangiaceae bacterium]
MAKKTPVTMYDAAVPDNIPASAQVVAGYVDGSYAWTADDWHKWPDADKVLITVNGSLKANVADVENGAMTADDARNWIVAKQKAHMRGCTIYCSQANLGSVWSACKGHAYYIWVADWTGSAHEVARTVATQYSSVDNQYDLSMVYSQEWLDTVQAANNPWPLG